jgi:hypothetical protein
VAVSTTGRAETGAPVSEPGSVALAMVALFGLGVSRKRIARS